MSEEISSHEWVIPHFTLRCIRNSQRSSVIDVKGLLVFYEEFFGYLLPD